MAAPIPDKVILPLDTGNTGKKVRTQTRVVGSDTVHEHFFIPISQRNKLGNFKTNGGVQTVPAGVHNGTTTGFLWLINPVGSARLIAVRRINTLINFTALAVDLLVGELRISRFTATGTGSAGLITPAKRDSADASNVGELRSASTGLAVTLGAAAYSLLYPTMDLATGGAGHWNSQLDWWEPNEEDEQMILRAGEGLVMWHAAAVTAANRRVIINLSWDEYE